MPIIIYGSPLLRRKSAGIDEDFDFTSLAANMMQTLKEAGGIGLAAPQVGLLKNMFIIDTTPLESDGTEKTEKAFINPEILTFSEDKAYYQEGCLSIPGIFEDISRPGKIHVQYRDLQFNLHEEELEGIAARIFQHEYDHLQGVLFVDRISPLRKKLIKKKLYIISKKNNQNI